MALRLRARRRRRAGAPVSNMFRRYLMAFIFLGLGLVIVTATTALVAAIPEATFNTTIGGTTISVSNRLFLGIIGFAIGIAVVLSAVKRFGVRL